MKVNGDQKSRRRPDLCYVEKQQIRLQNVPTDDEITWFILLKLQANIGRKSVLKSILKQDQRGRLFGKFLLNNKNRRRRQFRWDLSQFL